MRISVIIEQSRAEQSSSLTLLFVMPKKLNMAILRFLLSANPEQRAPFYVQI